MNTEREELTFDYDKIIQETPNAVLLSIFDTDIWLPKSEIELDKSAKTVYMPEWLAIEKDLV